MLAVQLTPGRNNSARGKTSRVFGWLAFRGTKADKCEAKVLLSNGGARVGLASFPSPDVALPVRYSFGRRSWTYYSLQNSAPRDTFWLLLFTYKILPLRKVKSKFSESLVWDGSSYI